jgi:hypothetical protein
MKGQWGVPSYQPILFLYLRSSSSRFYLTWAFHRSLASKVMPRYLALLAYGTFWLLIVIEMCLKHLLVKLIWTDLNSLSWMCPEALKRLLIWTTSTWWVDSGKGPKTNPEGTTVSHQTSYTQSFCYNFNIVHLEWYGRKLHDGCMKFWPEPLKATMLTRDMVDTRLWINYLYLWPNYSVNENGASKRCNKTLRLSLYV